MGNECPFIMKADTCGLWHWHNGNEPMFGRVCSPGINEHRACQQEKERQEYQRGLPKFEDMVGILRDERQENNNQYECDWMDGSHNGARCKKHPEHHYFSKCNLVTRTQHCCHDQRTGPADRRVNEQPTTGSVRRNGRDAFYHCNDRRKSRGRRKGD